MIRSDQNVEVLPLRALWVTQPAQSHQTAIGCHERTPDQASGRSEHTCLAVSVAVTLAAFHGEVPTLAGGVEKFGWAMVGIDPHHEMRHLFVLGGLGLISGSPVIAHDPQHRLSILGELWERPDGR